MADYVVDATIVIQQLIEGPYTNHVRSLFRGLIDTDSLYIPEFCLLECTNVFWKRVRFQSMPQNEAEALIEDLLNLPFDIVPIEELLPRALQIGLTHQLAIYDSLYIALAEKYRYPLITADTKQAAAKAIGVTIKPITDF